MLGAERRAVAVLASVFAVRMLGLFLLLPIIALYAASFPEASTLMIGLAVGAYGITQALFQIPFGLLSDRIGHKPVIVSGLLIFALGSLLAALADSATMLVLGRILQGAGAVSAAITALVADLTRVEVRTRAMAVIGMTIGASFLLALIAGPLLAAWVGVSGVFQVTAVLALAAAAGVSFAVPSPALPAETPGSLVTLRAALAVPALLRLNLGVLVLHAVLTASFVAVPLTLDALWTARLGAHAQVYLFALLASLPPTVALIIANDRKQRPLSLALLAIGLLALAQCLLAVSVTALTITLALAVFFAGFNFLEARLPARLSELASPGVRGAALGVFATCQFLGAFLGGVAGGWIFGLGGAGAVHLVCAALTIIWLLVVLVEPARAAQPQS